MSEQSQPMKISVFSIHVIVNGAKKKECLKGERPSRNHVNAWLPS